MAKSDNNLVVGLDIGTSKVLVIVAEVSPDGDIEIIGVGHHPARSQCCYMQLVRSLRPCVLWLRGESVRQTVQELLSLSIYNK